jgi:ATP adenylyltransferase
MVSNRDGIVTGDEEPQLTERLWTPWRMGYIGGTTKETGCIFCNRLQRSADVESLILHRGAHTFVIMNLYPYNTGHIMLVPNEHASDPVELAPDMLSEMGTALPMLTNALRRAFACHGFNVGLNIGAIAGAGVEAHLHEHIVPRWQGDANFMPILASTMTIPELIPVTYAKIRAELTRELTPAASARFVLLDDTSDRVLLQNGKVPSVPLHNGEPVVHAIVSAIPPSIRAVQLAGWAGPEAASDPRADDIVLTFTGVMEADLPDGWQSVPVARQIDDGERSIVDRARRQRAPALS